MATNDCLASLAVGSQEIIQNPVTGVLVPGTAAAQVGNLMLQNYQQVLGSVPDASGDTGFVASNCQWYQSANPDGTCSFSGTLMVAAMAVVVAVFAMAAFGGKVH